MCIRDSLNALAQRIFGAIYKVRRSPWQQLANFWLEELPQICLLYTSDAADERSSVDLGGRRIIKKKKHVERRGRRHSI